jgi:5-formyltetrahydrofolate cyclo-ligase
LKIQTVIPKSEARKLVFERRKEISEIDIRKKTFEIINNLSETEDFSQAGTVHTYIASRPGEVDTRVLIDRMAGWGKSIILPKLNVQSKSFRRFHFTSWDEIITNEEGYLEPKLGVDDNLSDIDLIIVPVLAITKSGHRVGYGGGYYDKILKEIHCPKYALAFEFQLFRQIEITSSDVKVDKIITEQRIINTDKNLFIPG